MVVFEFDVDWARAGWLALGALLALAVLWAIYSFIGTFVFALFIYYSTRRVHGHIRYRVKQPSLSATLALLTLALPGLTLLLYAVSVALVELQEFAADSDLGGYVDVADPYLEVSRVVEDPTWFVENAGGPDVIGTALSQATAYLGFIANALLQLFVMFAVAFYLLRDDHRLATLFVRLDADGGVLERYARAVDSSLERIFAGNILNAVVTGTVGVIAYSVLNLFAPSTVAIPYAALVGLLTGFASLIPVVGMKLVYVPLTGYLSVLTYTEGTGYGFVLLFLLVSFVVVDTVPDIFVRPLVTGGSLHTGNLMFAYVLGPLLFGWYGLFLGPMILVFATHFVGIVLPELVGEESAAVEDGAATETVDGTDAGTAEAATDETTTEGATGDGAPADDSTTEDTAGDGAAAGESATDVGSDRDGSGDAAE